MWAPNLRGGCLARGLRLCGREGLFSGPQGCGALRRVCRTHDEAEGCSGSDLRACSRDSRWVPVLTPLIAR